MIGIDQRAIEQAKVDERQFVKAEAIIQSMTTEEREDPDILNGKRRRRIAEGAGTTVQEVNRFMKQYNDTKFMMKRMMSNKGSINKLMKSMLKGQDPEELKKMNLQDFNIK